MSVNILLSALEEYLTAKKDAEAGCGDGDALLAARKRFALALNQYIDWRTDGVLEERGKRISTDHSIKLADLVTANIGDVNSMAALNSAPIPMEVDGHSKSDLAKWMDAYKSWYNSQRKQGLKSP